MQKTTIVRLNQLNIDFYKTVAKEFDGSRQYPWTGWERLFAEFAAAGFRVDSALDVGCGNGRFASALRTYSQELSYLGLDFNEELLAVAREKTSSLGADIEAKFELFDLVSLLGEDVAELPAQLPIFGSFSLTVAFGVIHHLPSFALRQKLLAFMTENTKIGGLVVVAAWQFMDDPKLVARTGDFSQIGLDEADLEPGDYLLDWQRGDRAWRYCHLVDEEEMSRLVSGLNLTLMADFKADGGSGQMNHYYVFKREK